MFVNNALHTTRRRLLCPQSARPGSLPFRGGAGRDVVARFYVGTLTSDGGAVLLHAVDRATILLGQFAPCFTDHRDPTRVTHPVAALLRRRVYVLSATKT